MTGRRAPRSCRFTLALACTLAGCGGSAASFSLAVGWSGPLPSWNGPCDGDPEPASVIARTSAGSYRAIAPGSASVPCKDGTLRLVVRTPDRITVEPTTIRQHHTSILRARVADARGELDVGNGDVSWTLPPQLPEGDRCSHMLGTCLDAHSVRVSAGQPGTFPVTVRFGAVSSTVTIRVD